MDLEPNHLEFVTPTCHTEDMKKENSPQALPVFCPECGSIHKIISKKG